MEFRPQEEIEKIEIQIPPPVSVVRPNWRTINDLPFGVTMLNTVDPERNLLDPDQQRAILRLESDEAMRSLLYANLSDPLNPDILMSEKVFSKLLMQKFELPSLLMTWQFYTARQCQLCIEDQTAQMKDKELTGSERVNAGKARMESIKVLNNLLANARSVAKSLGLMQIKRDRSKKPEIKSPKNDAPNFD